jgi:hypothetical protein
MIDDTISFTLETGIPYATNTVIDATDGFFPLLLVPGWVYDWETPQAAVVSTEAFSIGQRALFFDRQYGEQEPATTIPDMPYYNNALPSQYQMYVSAYTIDSFFDSYLEINTIKGWFLSSMIPPTAKMSLTTSSLNTFLPGIESFYGPDMPVDIHFTILELNNFTVSENNEVMVG